jgi:general secretion pathway protein G
MLRKRVLNASRGSITQAFRRLDRRGFTLLELLVVMVIIGLLTNFVAARFFDQIGKSEIKTPRAQLDAFDKPLAAHRLAMGRYPARPAS